MNRGTILPSVPDTPDVCRKLLRQFGIDESACVTAPELANAYAEMTMQRLLTKKRELRFSKNIQADNRRNQFNGLWKAIQEGNDLNRYTTNRHKIAGQPDELLSRFDVHHFGQSRKKRNLLLCAKVTDSCVYGLMIMSHPLAGNRNAWRLFSAVEIMHNEFPELISSWRTNMTDCSAPIRSDDDVEMTLASDCAVNCVIEMSDSTVYMPPLISGNGIEGVPGVVSLRARMHADRIMHKWFSSF